MKHSTRAAAAFACVLSCLVLPVLAFGQEKPGRQPNIVVIISDDQGYADVGYNPHHPKEVVTPHIDRLARSGVICTAGYVNGNVCSPTRAALMTGRYQQRCGIYTAGQGGSGLPLKETIFPQYLKPAGYVCGAFGKWHLGLTPEYNPVSRGFDEFYGFMRRGAHDYFDLANAEAPIYRGLERVQDKGYLTDRLTEEAVGFVHRHKDRPFFLYLAYNAVHAPPQAPEEDIKRFNTGEPGRDILMAMLLHLDAGVGKVVKALEEAGVYDNTLLFYLSDNGGAKVMHANNAPLRGFKHENYEGGVRVPFIVSWPAQLKGGNRCDVPVIAMDILPTALAAAGVPFPKERGFDGRNMLSALQGETTPLHEDLFWSSGRSNGEWAVQSKGWKLVTIKDRKELFNLGTDLSEATDLAARHPEKVQELTALYDAWLAEMPEPAGRQSKRGTSEGANSGNRRGPRATRQPTSDRDPE